MISLHKFKLLSFLSSVVLFQQSSAMYLKRAIRPISNHIRANASNIKKFTSVAKRSFDLQKIKNGFNRSFSIESKPTKLEDLPVRNHFILSYDDLNFEELLKEYKEAKNNKSISKFTRAFCAQTLRGVSRKEIFDFCTIGCSGELHHFLETVAGLTGSSIAFGDTEFGNIVINWALESNELEIAQEYVKDNKIEELVGLVKNSLLTNMYQYYYDYLKHKKAFKNKESQEAGKAILKKHGFVISDAPKYKDFSGEVVGY